MLVTTRDRVIDQRLTNTRLQSRRGERTKECCYQCNQMRSTRLNKVQFEQASSSLESLEGKLPANDPFASVNKTDTESLTNYVTKAPDEDYASTLPCVAQSRFFSLGMLGKVEFDQ